VQVLRAFNAIPSAGRAIHRIGWSPTSSATGLGELRWLSLVVQRPDGHVAGPIGCDETSCILSIAATVYDKSDMSLRTADMKRRKRTGLLSVGGPATGTPSSP
jgi:hypothetical protein